MFIPVTDSKAPFCFVPHRREEEYMADCCSRTGRTGEIIAQYISLFVLINIIINQRICVYQVWSARIISKERGSSLWEEENSYHHRFRFIICEYQYPRFPEMYPEPGSRPLRNSCIFRDRSIRSIISTSFSLKPKRIFLFLGWWTGDRCRHGYWYHAHRYAHREYMSQVFALVLRNPAPYTSSPRDDKPLHINITVVDIRLSWKSVFSVHNQTS